MQRCKKNSLNRFSRACGQPTTTSQGISTNSGRVSFGWAWLNPHYIYTHTHINHIYCLVFCCCFFLSISLSTYLFIYAPIFLLVYFKKSSGRSRGEYYRQHNYL